MWLSTSTVGKFIGEIDEAVEGKASVVINVNVLSLEISRCVDDPNFTSLNKVIGDNHVLLVRSDLDVVGPDDRMHLIRVIKTLHVVQVTDVKGSNVVGSGQSQVDKTSILADVGAVVTRR